MHGRCHGRLEPVVMLLKLLPVVGVPLFRLVCFVPLLLLLRGLFSVLAILPPWIVTVPSFRCHGHETKRQC